jgi:hypothetical protein
MKNFRSWRSYHCFEQEVKRKNRYFYDLDVKDFLQTVLETGKSREEILKDGKILWRSQLGNDWDPYHKEDKYIGNVPCAFNPKRMKPPKNTASEGRANPKGIPYLYLSTDKNTAMAEVRPWVGSCISLAQFKLLRDVTIINCSSDDKGTTIYLKEPKPEEKIIAIWRDIDKAFSRPVTQNESIADYVPTQIIAELFKKNGFDGIAYRSSLGEGHNIVLFDLNVADLINRTLYETTKISFKFDQSSTTSFNSKYYKKNGTFVKVKENRN